MPRHALTLCATALATLIWGSSYYVATEYLPPDRPLTAALIRCLPAGLLLLLWTREWPRRAVVPRLINIGVLNIAFFQTMLFVSAYRLPGGLAAILNSTQTLLVLALMALAGMRPPKAAWLAAALGVAGIVLLVASPQNRYDPLGIAAALAGACAMAAGIFLTKRWQMHLSVLALTGWQLTIGGLCLLPLALAGEPPLPALTARNIGGYAYLCLCGTLLAYVLFFRGIRWLSPATVSSLGLLSPVCAFALGWLFLDQRLGIRALTGFVLVLASIYGVQRAMMRKAE